MVTELAKYFRYELTPEQLEKYVEGLQDVSQERLRSAYKYSIQRHKKMPFVSELRDIAYEKSERDTYGKPVSTGDRCEKCSPDGWTLVPHPSGVGNVAIRCTHGKG
jgi:hypothetical protein